MLEFKILETLKTNNELLEVIKDFTYIVKKRKEIGARTKRAMEEMALEYIHPSKAPYGYVRNKDTGHLEVEPIEAGVVKEIFKLCKEVNQIAVRMHMIGYVEDEKNLRRTITNPNDMIMSIKEYYLLPDKTDKDNAS